MFLKMPFKKQRLFRAAAFHTYQMPQSSACMSKGKQTLEVNNVYRLKNDFRGRDKSRQWRRQDC